jgi:hypothetical protein
LEKRSGEEAGVGGKLVEKVGCGRVVVEEGQLGLVREEREEV